MEGSFIKLMEIEKSLLHLYSRLADTDNREKHLEYLTMTIEEENHILKRIDFSKVKNIIF